MRSALAQLHLDEVWLIPTGNPVHRQLSGQASPTQRITWLEQMFADEARVHIKTWETASLIPSPTIATLRRFHAENPGEIPTWLMGMDSFLDMKHWVEFPAHYQLCNLAIFHRKGQKPCNITTPWREISLADWQQNPPQHAGFRVMLDANLPDISATQIRLNPILHQHQLPKSTCNAILACYASHPKPQQKREFE